MAEDRMALRRLAATSTIVLGLLSCVIAAAGVLAAPYLSILLLHDRGEHAALVALIMLAVPVAVTAQTYRALLSGARAVRPLVRIQILSDVGAMLVFAALILPLGLTGAVLGFMATHLLLFLTGAIAVRRTLGGGLLVPRAGDVHWSVIKDNAGYGLGGLIMTGASNLSVLLVSTMIIGALGTAANGIFANAWRIASVYLGAVTATAISYVLPTLTRAADSSELSAETNRVLRFYLLLLPPLMAAIMAGGELLVWLILSREFLPVAGLLLIFVPAELMRILGETTVAGLLARKKLRSYVSLFLFQAAVFVGGSALLLPLFGLTGAAAAYGLSTTVGAFVTLLAAKALLRLEVERSTARAFAKALLLLGGTAMSCALLDGIALRSAATSLLLILWVLWSLRDPALAATVTGFLRRFRMDAR